MKVKVKSVHEIYYSVTHGLARYEIKSAIMIIE